MRGATARAAATSRPTNGAATEVPPTGHHRARTVVAGLFIGLFFTALVFGAVIGSSGQPPADEAEAWTAMTRTLGASSTSMTGDGAWQVGIDVAPGTYETSGSDATSCTWAVHGADGTVTHEGTVRGTATVTLTQGTTFESSGCGSWARAD